MIGGTLIVHNAIQFDYCLEASLLSLLGICDEVVVVDGESDDGTYEFLKSFNDKKLSVIRAAWQPNSMGRWLSDLTNMARELTKSPIHLNLQADEVLHEDDYPAIERLASHKRKYSLHRINFWMDHKHRLKVGEKVSSNVVRLAPREVPSVGDAESLDPKDYMKSGVRIFHYGFIRCPKAFVAKSKPMQKAFFNTYDPMMDAIETEGKAPMTDKKRFPTAVKLEDLILYEGSHPTFAHKWLREKGYYA